MSLYNYRVHYDVTLDAYDMTLNFERVYWLAFESHGEETHHLTHCQIPMMCSPNSSDIFRSFFQCLQVSFSMFFLNETHELELGISERVSGDVTMIAIGCRLYLRMHIYICIYVYI